MFSRATRPSYLGFSPVPIPIVPSYVDDEFIPDDLGPLLDYPESTAGLALAPESEHTT